MNPVIIKTSHKRAVGKKNLREFTSLIFLMRVIRFSIKWIVNRIRNISEDFALVLIPRTYGIAV